MTGWSPFESTTDTQESFAIVNAYVPPGETNQMKGLIGIVEKLEKNYQEVIITGDLNAKIME